MTPRERALKVLRGEAPDAVPWFGDLDYWATALIGRGLKPAGFKTSPEYIDWHRELRVGFYLQGYFPFRMIFPDIRIEQWHEGPDRVRTARNAARHPAREVALAGRLLRRGARRTSGQDGRRHAGLRLALSKSPLRAGLRLGLGRGWDTSADRAWCWPICPRAP